MPHPDAALCLDRDGIAVATWRAPVRKSPAVPWHGNGGRAIPMHARMRGVSMPRASERLPPEYPRRISRYEKQNDNRYS